MSRGHDTRVPVSLSAIRNAECKCTGQTRIAFNWVALTWGACTRAVIAFLCLPMLACLTTTSHSHNRQRHNVITYFQYFSSSKEADGESPSNIFIILSHHFIGHSTRATTFAPLTEQRVSVRVASRPNGHKQLHIDTLSPTFDLPGTSWRVKVLLLQ